MDYLDILYDEYNIIDSKNNKLIDNKINIYNYSCLLKNYKNLLEVTKEMILKNCKILKSSFYKSSDNIEWFFCSTESLQEIIKICKTIRNPNIKLIIDTIKYIND